MPDSRSILKMPVPFRWGVATAAHQNEGDNTNNQWAAWERQEGRIQNGQLSGKATGWWDLAEAAADFDRAADLGLNSLRLSVEWSRIEPEEGVFSATGLRRYHEMIGLLCERGLEPMVTLHHFTDPMWLAWLGGWENPRVGDYFGRFVARVVDALGDQVHIWCTINEPLVYAYSGYLEGSFPPGARSLPRASRVLRRMMLAHGRAYRVIHAAQNDAMVGIAHHMQVMLPAHPGWLLDRYATRLADHLANGTSLTAVLLGRLTPPIGWGETVPELIDSADYMGLNYYSTVRATFDPTRPAELFTRRFLDPHGELSELTKSGQHFSEINPRGMYLALKRLSAYKKPIYITENGLPDRLDAIRPRFIATHLAEAWRAIQEGADVRGYYHWTLVDNFEWSEGYNLKFGLFEMDPETRARTSRTSAAVYARIAQANGIPRQVMERVAAGAVPTYFAG